MSEKEPADCLERLVAIEWDIIYDLQRQLDSESSTAEMVKISNTLAYHVNTLNNLLRRMTPVNNRESRHLVY